VDEKRAFTPHPEFNFGLHLAADDFFFALGHAGGCDGVGDFVTNPRNHTWLTGSVTRHIAANDPREINDIAGVWLVTEDELRIWGFHEFWIFVFDRCVALWRQITSAAP
jgi:hypothetical protein